MARAVVPEVFVLGSGLSLGNLTSEEIEYINSAECVMALNKYMAFYHLLNIMPTHVFFTDTHDPCSSVLQHIFDVCRRDQLHGLTFVLNQRMRWRIDASRLEQALRLAVRKVRGRPTEPVFRVPSNANFEYVTRPKVSPEGAWATSLDQPLFHFRGSMTTAFNYISIRFPNRRIKLVGVDMNSSRYFFQDELEQLEVDWQDWTTPIIQKEGKHFSAVKHNGTTIFDRFDEVIAGLQSTNNELVNCYCDSLLVTKGFTPYAPVISPEYTPIF